MVRFQLVLAKGFSGFFFFFFFPGRIGMGSWAGLLSSKVLGEGGFGITGWFDSSWFWRRGFLGFFFFFSSRKDGNGFLGGTADGIRDLCVCLTSGMTTRVLASSG